MRRQTLFGFFIDVDKLNGRGEKDNRKDKGELVAHINVDLTTLYVISRNRISTISYKICHTNLKWIY